jgi:lysozyme
MRQRNYLVTLCGLCMLAQACNADHRLGHRARGEAQAKRDSVAAIAGGTTAAGAIGDSSVARGAGSIFDYPADLKEVASECRSEVAGIDISHWDGDIDWAELDKESIYFVYMKATEGESYVDPTFGTNWAAIRKTSLRRGAYLFFDPGLAGDEQTAQAQNFINTVKNIEAGDLPPMLDVEDDPEVPVAVFQSRLLTVVRLVESYFHARPIIYTTTGLYKKYLNWHNSFRDYELWIADYCYRRPQLCDKKDMRIWQFTDKAKLKGIPSPVDMDIFYTTPEDLENLVLAK